MTKIFYTLFALLFVLGGFFVAEAVNPFDIEYPVQELGSCSSQEECKVFCDEPNNAGACIAFAERVGMIKAEDAERMRQDTERFERELEEFENSPGQCRTPRECDAYCRVEEHLDECLDYGVKYGHTTQEEVDRIRTQADKGGPGGCKSKEECDNFCQNPENEDICFAFVVEEGKITQEEAEFMRERMKSHRSGDVRRGDDMEDDIDEEKVEILLKEMNGPGGCSTMDECDVYCSDFSHGEECMQFAIENQIVPPEALERMKKMSAIKSGPGGCVGQEECDNFCSQSENGQECFEFTKKHELVSPEELRMMEREMEIGKKLNSGMVGPGGCMGPEECDNFCRNPENMEECISFSGEHDLLRGETVENMMGRSREVVEKMKQIEGQRDFYDDRRDPRFENNIFGGDGRYEEGGYFDRDSLNIPEECKKANALSPEACERHMMDTRNMGPGCGDCSANCPTGANTNCINDRCVCGEVGEGFINNPESNYEIPPYHDDRFIPPTKDDYMNEGNFEQSFDDGLRSSVDGQRPSEDYRDFDRNYDPNMMPPTDEHFNGEFDGMIPPTSGQMPPEGYHSYDPNMMPPMEGSPTGGYPMMNDDGMMLPSPPTGEYYEILPPPPESTTSFIKPFSLLGFIINSLIVK